MRGLTLIERIPLFELFYRKRGLLYLGSLISQRLSVFCFPRGSLEKSQNTKTKLLHRSLIWIPVFGKTGLKSHLKGLQRLEAQGLVRSDLIVEPNIIIHTLTEMLL